MMLDDWHAEWTLSEHYGQNVWSDLHYFLQAIYPETYVTGQQINSFLISRITFVLLVLIGEAILMSTCRICFYQAVAEI